MAKAEYRSAIRSRQLITEALADLLQEKPLNKITVTDVVNRAQINRGTFYAHYQDIPDVIGRLVGGTFTQLLEQPLSAPDQTPAQRLHRLLELFDQIFQQDLAFYRKIMCSSAFPLIQQQLTSAVLETLAPREAEFGFENHQQYLMAMHFCAGGLANLYRAWFSGQLSCPFQQLHQQAEHLLRTILAGGSAA